MKLNILKVLIILIFLSGCQQFIAEKDGLKVKVNTFLMKIDFDWLQYGDLLVEKYKSESPEIRLITPYGAIETGD